MKNEELANLLYFPRVSIAHLFSIAMKSTFSVFGNLAYRRIEIVIIPFLASFTQHYLLQLYLGFDIYSVKKFKSS